MSGTPRLRSVNGDDAEARPVLGPAGNKARAVPSARKPSPKPSRKPEKDSGFNSEEKKSRSPSSEPRSLVSALSAPSALRRHELLLHSNLSLTASCSSDASTDSFCSRASTGRIGRTGLMSRRKQCVPRPEKIAAKLEKIALDSSLVSSQESLQLHGKRRCAWVTPNTDPLYAIFHDEEWGVPVHDDKKLFELLVLSGALAELTWPVILSKRHIFREVFMDFDPVAVSKMNEKKILAPGSMASSLLSEPKLRAIIENARQILKVIEEFGSFESYCWSFVNNKPIVSRFRYSRQVPVKTPKADVISKDLVRRGFRSVGPTVIYSFMQAAGITNDHLISCYRFEECIATQSSTDTGKDVSANNPVTEKNEKQKEMIEVGFEFSSDVDELSAS
ncbi:Methyladenine glycosylase protein [Dioscorea alata]|uniref:Methyladenine glycosylase protein n=1 Tax=Dioscorea alata TaxID=55571 RepID=A0ACB7UIE6_DIOAL|nr:Methyladenine glycosylase protein [Dioscorea alata]